MGHQNSNWSEQNPAAPAQVTNGCPGCPGEVAGGSDWQPSQPMGARGLLQPAGFLRLRGGVGGVPRCCSRSRPRAGEAGGRRTHEQVRGAEGRSQEVGGREDPVEDGVLGSGTQSWIGPCLRGMLWCSRPQVLPLSLGEIHATSSRPERRGDGGDSSLGSGDLWGSGNLWGVFFCNCSGS